MLYRSHLRPPSNNLSRAFGLSRLLSAHQRRRRWRIWLLGEKDREREKETKAGEGGGRKGKRKRKRTTRTEETRWRRSRVRDKEPEKKRTECSLHVARRCTDEPRDTESIFVGWLRRWRDKKPAASTPVLPRISIYLCLPFFLSDRFFPAFPSPSLTPTVSPALSPAAAAFLFLSTLSPRRSYSLFFLFSLRLFLCHRTALVSVLVSRSHLAVSLFPPFSPSFFLLLPNSTTSVAFSPILPAAPLPLPCANRSRTRASEREDQNREENEEMREKERGRQREGKGDGIRVPYIRERAKTRRGRAGAREREAGGRRERGQGRCTGEERWDMPRAERGRGRREAVDGKARTCKRDAARTEGTR